MKLPLSITLTFSLVFSFAFAAPGAEALKEQVSQSLRKGAEFFRTRIAVEGTYLWQYSADLARREGEGKATDTQGWVQPPGTPSVGLVFLEAYTATGASAYLEAARETGRGLIRGQLLSGGWDYKIDFSPKARQQYAYREDGNPKGKNVTTLDDDNTQMALTFMMRLDAALKFQDQKVHECVTYALDSLVKAQYPVGAWPQRYDQFVPEADKPPVKPASYPDTWERKFPGKAYGQCYTLNDNSLADTLRTLFEAARIYSHLPELAAKCRAAAEKGGDFLILAQMPEPQPAWAQQYDLEMHPVWARKFEPPAVTGGESHGAMKALLAVYRETGKPKYLEPIPRAIAYLQRSRLADSQLARFYELRTNKPLYFTKDYQLTYDDRDMPTHYSFKITDATASIATDYERMKLLTPEKLKAPRKKSVEKINEALIKNVKTILASQNAQGGWIQSGQLRYHGDADPTREVISCETFIRNMKTLCRYLEARQ
jgi:hypothetical protein